MVQETGHHHHHHHHHSLDSMDGSSAPHSGASASAPGSMWGLTEQMTIGSAAAAVQPGAGLYVGSSAALPAR